MSATDLSVFVFVYSQFVFVLLPLCSNAVFCYIKFC